MTKMCPNFTKIINSATLKKDIYTYTPPMHIYHNINFERKKS